MLEARFVIWKVPVIIDPNQDQLPSVVLQPLRILLPVDLFDGGIGVFFILQLDQQRREIRLFRDIHQIRIALPRVQLRDQGIIILCRIIGQLNRIAESCLAVVAFVPRPVVRRFQQFRHRLFVAGPCGLQQLSGICQRAKGRRPLSGLCGGLKDLQDLLVGDKDFLCVAVIVKPPLPIMSIWRNSFLAFHHHIIIMTM